ncbi:hypothetical protein JCM19232_4725 [Vibrio ishigakensis]|uniref:Uncharacterized protein n=1 Tax=Vibrio ishigakensis TaxID=1481914 RepID=A0A0B8PJ13_9VIBR|nr:hypothetical protein JCM19232_4725 [Vibrio ishigakensis]
MVLAIASIIYIYSRYYGRDLGNMHRLPLSEKLLTGSFVRKYQPLIANNFFRHLSTFERAEQSLDSWELEKVRQFKQTKCLDNPTAFIIYDIYQAHLEKSTYSILEYK